MDQMGFSQGKGYLPPEFMWQFFINAYTTLFLIIKCTTLLWFIRKTWFSFFIPLEIFFLHVLSNSDEIAVTKSWKVELVNGSWKNINSNTSKIFPLLSITVPVLALQDTPLL